MVEFGKGEKFTMEKIKIYVTARIANILEKDAEGFEFFKKDGMSLNKNALITKLIVNYHARFSQEQALLQRFLRTKFSALSSANDETLNDLCAKTVEYFNDRTAAPAGEKFNVLLSLKPTKESEPIVEYIEHYELTGRTLSEYFRSMFASYAALPQDKREEIIFQPQYDALQRAIREKKRVFLTLNNEKKTTIETSPYALSPSKEELHLYLIAAPARFCTVVRLSRILSVKQLPDDAQFNERQIEVAEKMLRYGPQFTYRPKEETVIVELTPKGIDKFKRIYVHRPVPVKVEENRYYFECSYAQIIQYFVRFGSDAKILSPDSVVYEVYHFHNCAALQYRKPKKPR